MTATAAIDRNNPVQPRLVLASFVEVGTGGWLRGSTRGLMAARVLFFNIEELTGLARAEKSPAVAPLFPLTRQVGSTRPDQPPYPNWKLGV